MNFSEGSVLVDYFVELNELNEKLSTAELKKMFNNALTEASSKPHTNREAKATDLKVNRLTFGTFEVDPEYTDFVSKYLRSLLLALVNLNRDKVYLHGPLRRKGEDKWLG